MSLDTWAEESFTAAGLTRQTFRKGTGPGVVVVHEVPGITPAVLAFAEEVVAAGFTVVMPMATESSVVYVHDRAIERRPT